MTATSIEKPLQHNKRPKTLTVLGLRRGGQNAHPAETRARQTPTPCEQRIIYIQ